MLVLLAWPREDVLLGKIGVDEPLSVKRGLDLQGGAYLVYEADTSEVEDAEQALESAAVVIRRRVNPTGTSEAVVQRAEGNRIVVQLPGEDDIAAAVERIGRTAQLQFFEISISQEDQSVDTIDTGITGEDVQSANVDVVPQTGQVVVNLKFRGGESTDNFADLTTRLYESQNPLMVQLDNQVVFGPAQVQSPILTGESQLTNQAFTVQSAQEIADLLNAGALPVPIEIVAQSQIGPTLGADTIKQSMVAAIIGLVSLGIFLIAYYRLMGVAMVVTLVFYTAATVTLYKLSAFTPYAIVLTLAGIAGFILSIAVAADANILITERMKEEFRNGLSLPRSLQQGFRRAWTSIRDANVATIIGCVILYIFGTPIIKGFAVTLGLGVVLSLISVWLVSLNIFRWLLSRGFARKHPSWMGLGKHTGGKS